MKKRALALVLCFAFALAGCARTAETPVEQVAATATVAPRATEVPISLEGTQPIPVYRQVSTIKREISLVLEGFTSSETMQALFALLKERGVPCVIFLTGSTAADTPQFARDVIAAGLELGNYGLNEKKELEKNDADKNYRQLLRAQELLTEAAGVAPRFLRCNGTTYTDELLRAAAKAGLEAAVEPTAYLNHRSFTSAEEARTYVQRLVRGSILSVKLGQELDLAEYPDRGDELNERPAIDKQPGLGDEDDEEQSTGVWTYAKVLDVVAWLLDALEAEGYTLVLPDELEAMPIFTEARTLTVEQAALYDAAAYETPVTETALGVAESAERPSDVFAGTVFVGDSLTSQLEDYVEWRRTDDPTYLAGAQFLCAENLSVSGALQGVTATSRHPLYEGVKTTLESAIAQMGATRVYLMLGSGDMKNFSAVQYLANLKVLLYAIEERSPGVQFVIQSIPPGIAGRSGTPTNARIFAFDLALAEFCEEYDIPFVDMAYALRDEKGDLPESLCANVSTYGTALNDRACEIWISYLLTHVPF